MGFRVSWIARVGTSTKELLDVSRRSITGERHDFPDVGFYMLEMPKADGKSWVILIADGSENYLELDEKCARFLSKGGNETLYFWCSGTVMATQLVCFKGGDLSWSIQYDCENKANQPSIEGDVPDITHEILEDLQSQQRADTEGGADCIYDLTAELGLKLVGFRHDMVPETDDSEPFQVLL